MHSEDRQMVAETLRRFIAAHYDLGTRNGIAHGALGYSPELWAQFAELGAVGALFSEADGGYGGEGFDIMAVFEALGEGLVVEPFIEALMAGRALVDAGGHAKLVAEIIDGRSIVAFAHQERESRYDLNHVGTRAERVGKCWKLLGGKAVVSHAETAGLYLVSARTAGHTRDEDGISLFLVPTDCPGLKRHGYQRVDGSRAAELIFSDVLLSDSSLVGREGEGFETLERVAGWGLVAICAEAVGCMEVVKTMTLDYLRARTQFGVPIGNFQALQHRMSALLIEINQARSSVINAIRALAAPRLERERALSAAKYTIGRVGTLVAEEAIQLHGGMGMTWQLPLSHFAKRLIMIDHQLGDSDHHLERYVDLGRADREASGEERRRSAGETVG